MTEHEVREVSAYACLAWLCASLCRDRKWTDECPQRLGLDLIKTHKWTILPCSAMTGRNLHEGLEWVVRDAKDRLFLY